MKRSVRRWWVGLMLGMGLVLSLMGNGWVARASAALPPPRSLRNTPTAAAARLVDVHRVSPNIRLDIRYATVNNFTKVQLYQQPRCILRSAIAQQLAQVQADLEKDGFGLKVFDCYRPLSVQRKMWELCPDGRYVANPARGSRHNRGAAVDLTLVDRQGREVVMPTDFDDFTEQAWRTSKDSSAEAQENSQRLERAMVKRGFVPLETEWWHYDGPGWEQFPLIDTPFAAIR